MGRGNLFFKLAVHKQPVILREKLPLEVHARCYATCLKYVAANRLVENAHPPLNKRSSKTFGQNNFMGGNSTHWI